MSGENTADSVGPDSSVRGHALLIEMLRTLRIPIAGPTGASHVGMNNAILKSLGNVTMTVSLAQSKYGTPQPQIEICVSKGTHFRKLDAALHALAAEVELATPVSETWVVEIEAFFDDRGRVHLELAKGDDSETERGLALLRRVAG